MTSTWIETEEPVDEWNHTRSECFELIRYCDGLELEPWRVAYLQQTYGPPSPELRQMAKDRLKAAFMRYWETI